MKYMKNRKKLISVFIALVVLLGAFTAVSSGVFAWDQETDCEFCGSHIGDDWICSGGDHCGADSDHTDCYEAHHCADRGICFDEGVCTNPYLA